MLRSEALLRRVAKDTQYDIALQQNFPPVVYVVIFAPETCIYEGHRDVKNFCRISAPVFQFLNQLTNRQFSGRLDGFDFGAKNVKLRAELPQVVKGIGPLENQQRQQYDSADIGY